MLYLTRRAFLRMGAMSAAGLAIGGPLEKLIYALEKEGDLNSFQRAIKPYTAIPTVCLQCQAGCGILGLALDDELIGILGNPGYPCNKGGICARAAAGVNLIYDPERVLYPLKRRGQRGSNQWKRISWHKAIGEISSRMAELRSRGQTDQFLIQIGVDEGYTPTQSLLNNIGTPTLIDDLYLRNLSKIKGHELIWGEGAGYPDVGNSHYLLNFGSNPYENHDNYIPFVQRLISARRNNNARLITFDVRLSNTAGLSDEWYPVRPGTDIVVILAMCKIILEHGLEDKDFLNRGTNISKDQIISHLTPYTPQMAEKVSGINKKDIMRIAIDFATFKPSVAFCGGGLTDHQSGTYNQMAILLLNALVGGIDEKGGYCLPKRYRLEEPVIHSIKSGIDYLAIKEKRPISLYMTYLSNPIYSEPGGRSIREILKDEKLIPFYIAADTHMTETSMFADIVLPVATCFESWGLDARDAMDMIPYIGLRQPIIRPRGEALPFYNILAEIGKGIGEDSYYDVEGYIRRLLKKIEGLNEKGDFRNLKKEGFWTKENLKPIYRSYRDIGFKTPSGKMELYSVKLEKDGFSPLPIYKAIDKKIDVDKGKLFFTTFSVNAAATLNPNSKWLSEIFHENPLWINEKTAQRFGIANGEKVEISSERGKAVVIVRLTQAINPEVVAISKNLGHWAYGHIAKGKEFKSSDADTSLIWWGNSKSFHVSWLLSDEKDMVSGGKALMDTVVDIKKLG
jgi:thiosulfate reductase/polysulfide reductase chain A